MKVMPTSSSMSSDSSRRSTSTSACCTGGVAPATRAATSAARPPLASHARSLSRVARPGRAHPRSISSSLIASPPRHLDAALPATSSPAAPSAEDAGMSAVELDFATRMPPVCGSMRARAVGAATRESLPPSTRAFEVDAADDAAEAEEEEEEAPREEEAPFKISSSLAKSWFVRSARWDCICARSARMRSVTCIVACSTGRGVSRPGTVWVAAARGGMLPGGNSRWLRCCCRSSRRAASRDGRLALRAALPVGARGAAGGAYTAFDGGRGEGMSGGLPISMYREPREHTSPRYKGLRSASGDGFGCSKADGGMGSADGGVGSDDGGGGMSLRRDACLRPAASSVDGECRLEVTVIGEEEAAGLINPVGTSSSMVTAAGRGVGRAAFLAGCGLRRGIAEGASAAARREETAPEAEERAEGGINIYRRLAFLNFVGGRSVSNTVSKKFLYTPHGRDTPRSPFFAAFDVAHTSTSSDTAGAVCGYNNSDSPRLQEALTRPAV